MLNRKKEKMDTCMTMACSSGNIDRSLTNVRSLNHSSYCCQDGRSGDIESVEDQNMMIVLCKSHHVAFTRDLQTAAAGNLDMRTLELRKQVAVISKYCHVEPVPMRVANKNISSIGDVDSVWEVGDAFAPNSSYKDSFLCENNIVALKVADIELSSPPRNVTGFPHVVGTVKP